MKFCDFAKLMHDNYEEKANAGKFVVILIDAILDGEALEKANRILYMALENQHWRLTTVADVLSRGEKPRRLFHDFPRRHSRNS